MIYKMTLKDSADEMTFDLLEVPIVDKDIEGAVDNVTLDGNQYTDYLWLKKQFIQKWSILCDDEYTRLRGFYTRQFENADVPSYRLYYGDDIVRNSTLSGEYIQFSVEGVADGTISLTQIDGNIIQDGTPTPSAPVPVQTVTGAQNIEVVGKNLWGGFTAFSLSSGGLNFTNNADGSVTASGTATSNASSIPSVAVAVNNNWLKTLPSGDYIASAGTLPSGVLLQLYNAKTGASIGNAQGQFTLTEQTQVYARIRVANGTTVNATFNIQLERGPTATAYEPYQGQDYEINLGKNLVTLADGVETSNSITSTTSGSTISYSGTPSSTWAFMTREYSFSERLPVGTYTFSIGEASSTNGFLIALYDADRTQTTYAIPMGAKSVTFTRAKESIAYRFALSGLTAGTAVNSSVSNLQLEKGSTATTYVPYFTPIELCKIGTYQDRIYKENGKWYIEKQVGKVVLDGTQGVNSTSFTNLFMIRASAMSITYEPNGLSDRFTYNNGQITDNDTADQYMNDGEIAFRKGTGSAKDRLYIRTTVVSTNTELKTWFGTNPTTVYYALATPTTTEITNEEVLEGLDSLLLESISVGQHNIYTDTPNALPTLTFDLTEYLSQSTTIIPETAVRLTLTDGGVINACGCRKDVQLTMRETIE